MTFVNRDTPAQGSVLHSEGVQAFRRRPLLTVIVLVAAACYCAPLRVAGQEVSQPLPDVTFRTYEKETIRTADLKGDVVFVGLWATGSKNCTAMRESLERLDKQFAVQGVWFLSVSEDEKQQSWKEYLFHHSSPMTEVWDENHSFRRKARLTSLPTIFVVDRGGQIRWRSQWTPAADSQASAQLTSLMQEAPPK
jgi:peroxiredoxin